MSGLPLATLLPTATKNFRPSRSVPPSIAYLSKQSASTASRDCQSYRGSPVMASRLPVERFLGAFAYIHTRHGRTLLREPYRGIFLPCQQTRHVVPTVSRFLPVFAMKLRRSKFALAAIAGSQPVHRRDDHLVDWF